MPEPTTRASGDDPMTTATAEMFMRQRDDLAARVDALREENERLRIERDAAQGAARELCQTAEGLIGDRDRARESDRHRIRADDAEAERDALRARVEELERVVGAFLRWFEDPEASWSDLGPWADRARDLLFGGSQEPRPDTTRPMLPESDESIRAAIDQHRDQIDVTDPCMSCDGTDGHHTAGCYWAPHEEPRPDTDETCPNCEGLGTVDVGAGYGDAPGDDMFSMECPACEGSGRRPDTKETSP